MLSGIYKIKNKKTKKVYIGSSIKLKRRLRSHKSNLKKNQHCNKKLQSSYNKWGRENFSFNIIKVLIKPSKEKLLKWEQYYIDKYESSKRGKGYNICPVAGSALGRIRKKSSIRKMLKTFKTIDLSKTQKQKDHLSKIFTGITIREEVRLKIIANWNSGDLIAKGKAISKSKLKNREKKGKTYKVISPTGKIIIIQNLTLYCESLNLKTEGFRKLFRGVRKSYHKYKRCN